MDACTEAISTACSRRMLSAAPSWRGLEIEASGQRYRGKVESALDALADHIETHLDVEGLLALAR